MHAAIDAAGVEEAQRPAYLRALAGLAAERNHRGAETECVKLVDHFQYGLNSPICLTWELTYACNLACVHCLSSSGRRDPRELTTAEAKAVIDELQRMQVFYVNIGGGEPTVRPDFWELLDYAIAHDVGVKFSTNGIKLDQQRAAQLAATDYVDVQISLDGATAEVNDHVRGPGSYDTAMRALENLAEAGFGQPKISVVMTRQNVDQLDEFKAIADKFGAQLRITRLRPSGRGADVWDELHPTAAQQRAALRLAGRARRERAHRRLVLPPLGLRRGAAGAEPVRRGAGGVPDRPGRRRLRLPVRDPRELPRRQRPLAGRVRRRCGGTRSCSRSCASRRPAGRARRAAFYDSCQGGCMAAKFFTGLPLDGPGPGVRARVRRAGPRGPRRPTRRSRSRTSTTRARHPRQLAQAEGAGPLTMSVRPARRRSRTGRATRARSPGSRARRRA